MSLFTMFEIWSNTPILYFYIGLLFVLLVTFVAAWINNREIAWILSAVLSFLTLLCAIVICILGDAWKVGLPSIYAAIAYGIMLLLTLWIRGYWRTEKQSKIPWKVLSLTSFYTCLAAVICFFGVAVMS